MLRTRHLFAVSALALSACSTGSPAPSCRLAVQQHLALQWTEFAAEYEVSSSERINTLVRKLGAGISVYVADSDVRNALAFDSKVVLMRGMLALDDAALLFVIAHETAHVLQRDPQRQLFIGPECSIRTVATPSMQDRREATADRLALELLQDAGLLDMDAIERAVYFAHQDESGAARIRAMRW